MKQHQKQQKIIRLGTHGEDYGSWMSNPVFYMIGGLLTLSAVLAALSFSMFHIAALGILFSVAAAPQRAQPLLLVATKEHSSEPDLVCMDTETVRFRRRRNDGAGPSGRPLPSGF